MIHPASFKVECDECGDYVRRIWPRDTTILATAQRMLRKELAEVGWRYDAAIAEDWCPRCVEADNA